MLATDGRTLQGEAGLPALGKHFIAKAMPLDLIITETPDPADLETIGKGLTGFNEHDVGPANRRALAVILRDGETVHGGLSGYTAWGWLYVQWLWLAEGQRGQGYAAQMLALAETEARIRGCHGAYIDTFNPTALRVYRQAGYEVFGELPDFPEGRTRSFLAKRFP